MPSGQSVNQDYMHLRSNYSFVCINKTESERTCKKGLSDFYKQTFIQVKKSNVASMSKCNETQLTKCREFCLSERIIPLAPTYFVWFWWFWIGFWDRWQGVKQARNVIRLKSLLDSRLFLEICITWTFISSFLANTKTFKQNKTSSGRRQFPLPDESESIGGHQSVGEKRACRDHGIF